MYLVQTVIVSIISVALVRILNVTTILMSLYRVWDTINMNRVEFIPSYRSEPTFGHSPSC